MSALGCPTCQEHSQCLCKQALTRYFEILLKVNGRVSTPKDPSVPGPAAPVRQVGIDKVSGEFQTLLGRKEIEERMARKSIAFSVTRLKSRNWYLQIGHRDFGLFFELGHKGSERIKAIVSRPSAFISFSAYQDYLADILSSSELASLRVTRLDVAIDYEMAFSEFIQGFEVRNKQVRTAYTDEGPGRTGILFGRGTEKIQVYDKALESGLTESLSRLELQLAGSHLPTQKFTELSTALVGPLWQPFDAISISKVRVLEPSEIWSQSQRERMAELSVLLRREGYSSARRALNGQGNFERDYLPFLEVQPWSEQPTATYNRLIHKFLNLNSEEKNGNDGKGLRSGLGTH